MGSITAQNLTMYHSSIKIKVTDFYDRASERTCFLPLTLSMICMFHVPLSVSISVGGGGKQL